MVSESLPSCRCSERANWARVDDDSVMQWPVVELAEWEELRACPGCGRIWLAVWPEDVAGGMFLCRPQPENARRLREIDRPSTLRGFCLARLEEQLGALDETGASCRKVGCEGRRIAATRYCVEHNIAELFGRHLARLAPR